ncbi:MAG: PEP-CTERM sorting domain-containing protein, partial [Candidatus Spyradosoma sp.]
FSDRINLMKKTTFILLNSAALLAGTTLAHASTAILDINNSSSVSYDSPNIVGVGKKDTAISFTLDGQNLTATLAAGSGYFPSGFYSNAPWTGGLPDDASGGLSSSDLSAIIGSGFVSTSAAGTSSYTGQISLTISGLSAGSYSLSWLMASGSNITDYSTTNTIAGLGPTTWNVYLNGANLDSTGAQTTYTSKIDDADWTTATGHTTTKVDAGTASAHYMTLNFDVEEDGATIKLQAEKWAAGLAPSYLKSLQFAALTYNAPSIPEPSAFGLLAGVGVLALAVARRRRPCRKS